MSPNFHFIMPFVYNFPRFLVEQGMLLIMGLKNNEERCEFEKEDRDLGLVVVKRPAPYLNVFYLSFFPPPNLCTRWIHLRSKPAYCYAAWWNEPRSATNENLHTHILSIQH